MIYQEKQRGGISTSRFPGTEILCLHKVFVFRRIFSFSNHLTRNNSCSLRGGGRKDVEMNSSVNGQRSEEEEWMATF